MNVESLKINENLIKKSLNPMRKIRKKNQETIETILAP